MSEQKVTELPPESQNHTLEVYGVGLADDDPKNQLIKRATSEDFFGGGHSGKTLKFGDNKTLAFLPDFSNEKEESARIEQVIAALIKESEFPFGHGKNPDLYIAGGPVSQKMAMKISEETGRNVFCSSEGQGATVTFDSDGGMYFEATGGMLMADAKKPSLRVLRTPIYLSESPKMNAILNSLKFARSEEEIAQDRQFLDVVQIMGNCPKTMEFYKQVGGHDVVEVASADEDAFVFLNQGFKTLEEKIEAVVQKLVPEHPKTERKAVLAISGGMPPDSAAEIAKRTGRSIVYATSDTKVDVRTLKGSILLTTEKAKFAFDMVNPKGEVTKLPRQIRIHKTKDKAIEMDFKKPTIDHLLLYGIAPLSKPIISDKKPIINPHKL